MKDILLLTAALLARAATVTACGSGANVGGVGSPPPTPATNGFGQQPASGVGSWGDTPIYPGATRTQSGQIAPPPGSGISKIEARYYETSDSAAKVESFYKAQMPANGWQLQGWTEAGMIIGAYVKADTESLQISILPPGPGGKTVITLTRGTR